MHPLVRDMAKVREGYHVVTLLVEEREGEGGGCCGCCTGLIVTRTLPSSFLLLITYLGMDTHNPSILLNGQDLLTPDLVIECEYVLLEALHFDLIVFHPYRPLQQYLNGIQKVTVMTNIIIREVVYRLTFLLVLYLSILIPLSLNAHPSPVGRGVHADRLGHM